MPGPLTPSILFALRARLAWACLLVGFVVAAGGGVAGCAPEEESSGAGSAAAKDTALFSSRPLTPPGSFTSGVEGPAVDAEGILYAVNYERDHTIGAVTPGGEASVFVELPEGSTGNGIRFNSEGTMLVADYTGHNVLQVDMESREVGVYAHDSTMHQPNDLAIGPDDRLYLSDPNWADSTGQLWRVDPDGTMTRLEADMGTTNGIEVAPGGHTLYVGESVQRQVWAYDLSDDGQISNKRLFIDFPNFGMDGMRADTSGNVYITRYGKGTIAKVSPEGEVLREIELIGTDPSNIAFGGPDGRTAYVTMADRENIETFRVDQPGRSWQLFQQRME